MDDKLVLLPTERLNKRLNADINELRSIAQQFPCLDDIDHGKDKDSDNISRKGDDSEDSVGLHYLDTVE